MRRFLPWIAGGLAAAVLAAGAWTYPTWKHLLVPPAAEEKKDDHAHGAEVERVKISRQARDHLRLKTGKVYPAEKPYWRHLEVPGWVAERPGTCERLVSAPVTGIVEALPFRRGDLVKPGQAVCSLKIVSESLHAAQAALARSVVELDVATREKAALQAAYDKGLVPQTRWLDLESRLRTLTAAVSQGKQELLARGIDDQEVERIAQGKFLRRTDLNAPPFLTHDTPEGSTPLFSLQHRYEVEEVKVMLGETVQAGQPVLVLADHHELMIEGKVFSSEAALIQKAAAQGTKVKVVQEDPGEDDWPAFEGEIPIGAVSNRIDSQHQTLSFFLDLPNQFKEYRQGDRSFRLWRFRPGQRVRLKIPVQPYRDVYVLPAAAVVRQGPEAFVFRENGDYFERLPVHLMHEDREIALVADDGSLFQGTTVALSGAQQLNWALHVQAGKSEGHGHHHGHDH